MFGAETSVRTVWGDDWLGVTVCGARLRAALCAYRCTLLLAFWTHTKS